MSSTLKLRPRKASARTLRAGVEPVTITYGNGSAATQITYSDKVTGPSACLRCLDAPCMSYASNELTLPGLNMFPADGTPDVCPTNALTWPPDAETGPSIESDECIGCALCVARCPVGAIYVGSNGVALVSDAETPHIRDARGASTVKNAQDERKRFYGSKRRGSLVDDSDKAIEIVYQRIAKALAGKHPSFPALFSRNLLLEVGWNAAMRRRGDTNVRIDIAAERNSRVCAVEVEFSEAVVDAPRNVLDDLAVLIARYKQDKTTLNGLIVALTLANQRSEYFQVIEDVEKVLGIRIGTVTVGALMLLMWNGKTLGENSSDLPHASAGAPSIRPDIERMLGRKLKLSTGLASVLETPKLAARDALATPSAASRREPHSRGSTRS